MLNDRDRPGRAILRVTLLCALLAATSPGLAGADVERPDILLVTIDTLRADRLSAYGYERTTSPNLDALMRGGVRFEQARTVEPLTAPALCSMITSRYPHEHGASRNGLRMRRGLQSLPKLLSAAGYDTAAFVGNWTLRDKISRLAEHFDRYDTVLTRKRWFGLVSSETTADDLTEVALKWLRDRDATTNRPFFLWVHYVEPHAPYRLHEEFLPQVGIVKRGKVRPEDRYDTEIAFVDRSVGELLDGVAAITKSDDTLVAFTSDHGESLGEHDYWGHGRNLYEPTLRVPMSLTWAGRLEPSTIRAPALILDLAPTIAGLLGLQAPDAFSGHDWTPTFSGAAEPVDRITWHQAHRGAVLTRHDSELARRSGLLEVGRIQNSDKELYRIETGKRRKFDLRQDPHELYDTGVSRGEPTGELREWMRVVYTGLSNCDEEPPEPLDQESVERLRSLGYAD